MDHPSGASDVVTETGATAVLSYPRMTELKYWSQISLERSRKGMSG